MAPKSNAVYLAYGAARKDARQSGSLPVPPPLRNAPSSLMAELGHGRDYRYDHDCEEGVAFEQRCFPDKLGERVYYRPVDRGLEQRIRERLDYIRERRGGRS